MLDNLALEWLHEDRILYARLQGQLTDDIFLDIDQHLFHALDGHLRQVHIVFDNTDVLGIPSVKIYRNLYFTNHPNLGWGVSFGDNDITRFFMRACTQMNRVYFHACDSYDDCLSFLGQVDKSLMPNS